jgi:hypothetical protein
MRLKRTQLFLRNWTLNFIPSSSYILFVITSPWIKKCFEVSGFTLGLLSVRQLINSRGSLNVGVNQCIQRTFSRPGNKKCDSGLINPSCDPGVFNLTEPLQNLCSQVDDWVSQSRPALRDCRQDEQNTHLPSSQALGKTTSWRATAFNDCLHQSLLQTLAHCSHTKTGIRCCPPQRKPEL